MFIIFMTIIGGVFATLMLVPPKGRNEGGKHTETERMTCDECRDGNHGSCVCFPSLGRCPDCPGCCSRCWRRNC